MIPPFSTDFPFSSDDECGFFFNFFSQGRLDIDAEIGKIRAKLHKAQDGVARQQRIVNEPAYQQKAGAELQAAEQRKLRDFEAEVRTYEESVRQFERLRLE